MAQPENRRINIRDQPRVLLPRLILNPGLRSTRLCGKVDSAVNSEGRKEDVIFRTILNVTTVHPSNLRRSEGVVVDVTCDGVVFGATISKCFEECCAP